MSPRVGSFIAAHRRNPLLGRLARACWSYLAAYSNFDYDPRTNGELRVLQALAALEPRCVFDVGANIGDWTALARTPRRRRRFTASSWCAKWLLSSMDHRWADQRRSSRPTGLRHE